MDNRARKLDFPAKITQEAGTVTRVDGGAFVVHTPSGDYHAKRAVSCLVEPREGDYVLLSVVPANAYVLAVLERDERAKTTVAVDGDLEFQLRGGRFTVAAQEGVDLVSAKDVSVTSAGLDVNTGDGNVVVQRLSFLGTLVRAEVEKVKVLAGSFDSVLDRLSQRVKRAYRTVEEFDQLRAERIDYVAKKNMTLRGENALISAEELVKVDGDQIHLG